MIRALPFVLGVLLVASCDDAEEVATVPPPQEPTREAIGHYCNMIVVDHSGPKGHIFLASRPEPIWFSSVRDTIAFTMLPEEADDIVAIYVNDMAQARNWDAPEPGTWIAAETAVYVIGSDRRGGMGAPEAVPFGDRDAALAFIARHGGRVVGFAEIPEDAILGDTMAGDMPADGMTHDAADHGTGSHRDHGQATGNEMPDHGSTPAHGGSMEPGHRDAAVPPNPE